MVKHNYLTYMLKEAQQKDELNQGNFYFCTTHFLAKQFDQKITAVNHQLNKLFKEGALLKINTKPVYYLPVELIRLRLGNTPKQGVYQSFEQLLAEYETDILEGLIGATKSLADVLRQCKVALKYPNNGLPLLITGATGTGKTFLVKQLHDYAVGENILNSDAPLTIFNCAEYADNPELLSAKLFGYKKGSFTGADNDRDGLLKVSDGGILFIDEVHRLSSESQEKLFYFIDEGKYKPLGENREWSHAKVRLMFATTESLDDFLLDTFMRRIPIVTKVPSLDSRGYQEKREFLFHFLKKEARVVQVPIEINREVFNFLIEYSYPGNVGEMENLVKYLVGNAFVQQSSRKGTIVITLSYLPKQMKTSALQGIDLFDQELILISPTGLLSDPEADSFQERFVTMYQKLDQQIDFFLSRKLTPLAFIKECYQLIEHYIATQTTGQLGETLISQQLRENLVHIKQTMYENHQIELNKESYQLIQAYLELVFSHGSHRSENEQVTLVMARLKEEFMAPFNQTHLLKELLTQFLPSENTLSTMDDLLMTVMMIYYNNSYTSEQIQGVIICHGFATASSIAQTANKMIGQRVFQGIDMDLDVSFDEITHKLRRYLSLHETRNGTLVLIDIGHTEDLRLAIQDRVEGPFAVIDNVSTKLALDVGFKVINHENIAHLSESAAKDHFSRYSLFEPEKPREKALIISCQTGIGTAQKLQEIFNQNMPSTDIIKLVVTDFDYLAKMKTNTTFFARYEVIGVIGTTDPQVAGVPYLGLDEMMSEEGINYLQGMFGEYLSVKEIHQLNNGLMQTLSLENLVTLLSILNPEKTIQLISEMIENWEEKFSISIPNNLRTALYIHISCMIERVITRTYVENQQADLSEFKREHGYFVETIKASLGKFESVYHVEVELSEIHYLHQLIRLNLMEFAY